MRLLDQLRRRRLLVYARIPKGRDPRDYNAFADNYQPTRDEAALDKIDRQIREIETRARSKANVN
jgi:hypothetical protein